MCGVSGVFIIGFLLYEANVTVIFALLDTIKYSGVPRRHGQTSGACPTGHLDQTMPNKL